MSVTATELERLHTEYRQAIEVARDESLEDVTREAATADAIAKREALDQQLIAAVRDVEIGNARAELDHILRPGTGAGGVPPQLQSIRDFCGAPVEGQTPLKRYVVVPFTRANEEWFTDTSSTVKAGYTVPSKLMTEVLFKENAESGVLLSGVSYVDTAEGNPLQWPMLATDAAANQTAERVAATLTNPVFALPQLDSYRMDGYMVLTRELQRDTGVDLWSVVTEVASRALATKIASAVATSDGVTKPHGLNHAATSGLTTATVLASGFTYDDLMSLYLKVLPRSRARGTWRAGSAAFGLIFKMKDTTGRPLMQPAVAAGLPDTLLGKPIYEDANYPALTASATPVDFGDASAYRVRRVGGVLIERDDSVFFTQFETVVRFAQYIDADLFDVNAVKKLTLAAA